MLYEIKSTEVETNKKDVRITNNPKVAKIFFDHFVESIGEILHADRIGENESWVCSESHIVEQKIILTD